VLAAYKFINGMWLFQLQPKIFMNRFDGFTWLFMKTGMHQWLIDNPGGWTLFDTMFYSMPLVFFLAHNVYRIASVTTAFLMLLINWVYVQCYTLYPSNSIEAHTAWLLFPVIFLASNPKIFRLLTEGLRYFFLFVLASAGIWKIVTGSIFNLQQMSGILLYQHADLLSTSPGYWQTNLIQWLIGHETIGYIFYLSATVLELVFIVGFFTKRYDHLLVIGFLVFLIFDHLIMRIPYYEMLPYLITMRIAAIHKNISNPSPGSEMNIPR
jgi:hypothetical protein